MDDEQLKQAGRTAAKIVDKVVGENVGSLTRTLLSDDHGTWDPVVPPDLHLAKLPAVADDGTAVCGTCGNRFPFAQLDIAGDGYACRTCAIGPIAAAPAQLGAGLSPAAIACIVMFVIAAVAAIAIAVPW
jgi:hypothetical protein